jgi:HD-GYP domain-containing protein (c-di-GMP phosphodiesterase class II)
MTTTLRRGGWGALALLPPLALLAFTRGLLPDPQFDAPRSHFTIVLITSCLLAGVAGLMAVAAIQVRDLRVFFLALAFLGIAGIFVTHALTTPRALIPLRNPWVGFSAYLGLLVGAACLAFSTARWPRRVERRIIARQGHYFAVAIAALLLYNLVAVRTSLLPPKVTVSVPAAAPATASYDAGEGYGGLSAHPLHTTPAAPAMAGGPFVPLADKALQRGIAGVTLLLLGLTLWRYLRRYRLAPSPLVAGLMAAAIFLAQAQLVMATTAMWRASWWTYHLLIFAAFVAAALGLAGEYARSGSLAGVVEGLLLRDSIRQLEHGFAEVIVALVGAVEAKDPYTRGHTQRVAELAVLIAQELRLSPEGVRTVGQAAILHDIGKIAVPDAILNKPGPLSAEEFAVVKEHPSRGHAMITGIKSLRRELGGVRSHHERLDGSGYPDGLRGEAIPLEARIIAVADVYDALTSRRPYRDAWSPAQALATVEAEAGTKLDARCVAALRRVLARASSEATDPTDRRDPSPLPFEAGDAPWIPAAD